MASLASLKVQLYADGADKAGILELYAKPHIKGLTTNPTLMKKAGIKDYEAFAKDILQHLLLQILKHQHRLQVKLQHKHRLILKHQQILQVKRQHKLLLILKRQPQL